MGYYGERGRGRGRGRHFHHDNRRGGRHHGGRRGGHHGGGGGYQRGYIEDKEPKVSARIELLKVLTAVGTAPAFRDDMPDEESRALEDLLVQQVTRASEMFIHLALDQPLSILVDAFVDCLLIKGHRAPFFACLLSLVNPKNLKVVEAVVLECGRILQQALAHKTPDAPGNSSSSTTIVKVLLRFFCSLAAFGLIVPGHLLTLCVSIIEECSAIADSQQDSSYLDWQPYTDYLAECVLLALPWGGQVLETEASSQLDDLMAAVEKYEAKRKCRFSREYMPCLDLTGEAPSVETDCGAASFLAELVAAVKECREGGWKATCVPQPLSYVPDASNRSAVYPVPELSIPSLSALSDGSVGPEGSGASPPAWQRYRPRGIVPLLPAHLQRAPEGVPAIDVVIAQEYMLHVLDAFGCNGEACVKELTMALPIPFPSAPLLVETLISQMLLSRPTLPAFAYQSLLVKAVEVVGQPLAAAFGGCIKTIFENVATMDVILLQRCSDLLSFFLSNNDYRWPWQRWARVLEAPPQDAQRRFCAVTLAKLLALCAHLTFMKQQVVPQDEAGWLELLPAKDEPDPLPRAEDGADTLQAPYDKLWAWLVEKTPDEAMNTKLTNEVLADTSARDALFAFVHAMLIRGKMTPFHTETLLKRYPVTLHTLCAAVNDADDAGAAAKTLLDVSITVWAENPQRFELTLRQLVAEGCVEVSDVMRWAFCPPLGSETGTRLTAADARLATAALTVLIATLTTLVDRLSGLEVAIADLQGQLPQSKALLAKAEEDVATLQAQSKEAADLDDSERQSVLDRIAKAQQAEANANARVQDETVALEDKRAAVASQQEALRDAMLQLLDLFVASAKDAEDASEGSNSDRSMLLNCLVSITRLFQPQVHVLRDAFEAKLRDADGPDDVAAAALYCFRASG